MTLAQKSSVARMSPLRFRLVTLSVVAAFLAASHLAFREAEARSYAQYLFVITLGYGHLLGAALGARRGARASPLTRAFVATTIVTGFALYVEGVTVWPGLAFALLALSVWHFTENDVAMARALRTGAALEPLPRHSRAQLLPITVAAAIVSAALVASPDPGLLGDLFSAATLFHLVGWLVFLIARGASPVRLLAVHAPAFVLCGLLLAWPSDAARGLREWAFSPAIYLYWASLHVVHTIALRRSSARVEQVTWLSTSTT
jgi:multisubunit Na+/H+ antiporter MnhC subunit